jgi:hypothetical protein
MDRITQTSRGRGAALDAAFVVAMAAGATFTVYMLSTSWPPGAWRLDLCVAVAIGACAILRRWWLTPATLTAVVLAAGSALVADRADLPQEPGPITGLALAVLVGACVRRGSAPLVAATLLGSAAVATLSWFTARTNQDGFTAVTVLLLLTLTAGALCGATLRFLDAHPPRGTR